MAQQRIHIVPSCGKLTACVAVLAHQLGHQVYCYDESPQEPMLSQLMSCGLTCKESLPDPELIKNDVVLIGNSLSRNSQWVDECMRLGARLISMPQWLYEHVLINRSVIAVSGTHGKTTTASLLTFLMKQAGEDVGYLVGGPCDSLGLSASLGTSTYFVIEADEYDTAFFDKRAKFFWYWPRVALINNLECDHLDIYRDLDHLKTVFCQWLQCVPSNGMVCMPKDLTGIYAPVSVPSHTFDAQTIQADTSDYSSFTFDLHGQRSVSWRHRGLVNAKNMQAACAVLHHLGFDVDQATRDAAGFSGAARRMSPVHTGACCVFDDFAHHPTSIKALLELYHKQRLHLVIYPENMYMKSDQGLGEIAGLKIDSHHHIYWCHNIKAHYSVADAEIPDE